MARVTEIRDYGKNIRSWKRQAEDEYPNTSIIDNEVLWSAEGIETHDNTREIGDCERNQIQLTWEEYNNLNSHRDAHYAALKEYL